MPTTIRVAEVQPREPFMPELPSVSIFLIIAMIQVTVALFSGGDWASFGEQALCSDGGSFGQSLLESGRRAR
jgi:flavodoxin